MEFDNLHFLQQKAVKEFVCTYNVPEYQEKRLDSGTTERLKKFVRTVESSYFSGQMPPEHVFDACELLNTILLWNFDTILDIFELENRQSIYLHFSAYFKIFPSTAFVSIHENLLKVLSRLFLIWLLSGMFEPTAPSAFLKNLIRFMRQIQSLSAKLSKSNCNHCLPLSFSFSPNSNEDSVEYSFSNSEECQSLLLFLSQLVTSISSCIHHSSLPLPFMSHLDECLLDLNDLSSNNSTISIQFTLFKLSINSSVQVRYSLMASLLSSCSDDVTDEMFQLVHDVIITDMKKTSFEFISQVTYPTFKSLLLSFTCDDVTSRNCNFKLNFGLLLFSVGIQISDSYIVRRMLMDDDFWFLACSMMALDDDVTLSNLLLTQVSATRDIPYHVLIIISSFIIAEKSNSNSLALTCLLTCPNDNAKLKLKMNIDMIFKYSQAIPNDNANDNSVPSDVPNEKKKKKKKIIENDQFSCHVPNSDVTRRNFLTRLKSLITVTQFLWSGDDCLYYSMRGPLWLLLQLEDNDIEVEVDDDMLPIVALHNPSCNRCITVTPTCTSTCRHLPIKFLTALLARGQVDVALALHPGATCTFTCWSILRSTSTSSNAKSEIFLTTSTALQTSSCVECKWFGLMCHFLSISSSSCTCKEMQVELQVDNDDLLSHLLFPFLDLTDDDDNNSSQVLISDIFSSFVLPVLSRLPTPVTWPLFPSTCSSTSVVTSSTWFDVSDDLVDDEESDLCSDDDDDGGLLDVVNNGSVLAELDCVDSEDIINFAHMHSSDNDNNSHLKKKKTMINILASKLLSHLTDRITHDGCSSSTGVKMLKMLSDLVKNIHMTSVDLLQLVISSLRILLTFLSSASNDDDGRRHVLDALLLIGRARLDAILLLVPALYYFIFMRVINLTSTVRREALGILLNNASIVDLVRNNISYISYALIGPNGVNVKNLLQKCSDNEMRDSTTGLRFNPWRVCLDYIHPTLKQFLLRNHNDDDDDDALTVECNRIIGLFSDMHQPLVQTSTDLIDTIQFKVVFDLIRRLVLLSGDFKNRHYDALVTFCSIIQSRSTATSATTDPVRSWIEQNAHRCIHSLVQLGWRNLDSLDKAKSMCCFLFIVSNMSEQTLCKSFPKILSCIHMGLSDASVLVKLSSIWSLKKIVQSTSRKALRVHFSTIVSCLIAVMLIDDDDDDDKNKKKRKQSNTTSTTTKFSDAEQAASEQLHQQLTSSCASMLSQLLSDDHKQEVDDFDGEYSFHQVPLSPVIPGYPDLLIKLSTVQSKSPISFVLQNMIGLLSHELVIVKKLVLKQLCYVLCSRRSELTGMILAYGGSDQADSSIVSDVIAASVQVSSGDVPKEIKNLCGMVLGEIGAIDPGRVRSCLTNPKWSASSSLLSNSMSSLSLNAKQQTNKSIDSKLFSSCMKSDSNNMIDFALFLLEKFIVPSLLSRNMTSTGFSEQDKSALTIQNLLKKMVVLIGDVCEASDKMPESLERKLKERNILDFVSPYFSTKYFNTVEFKIVPPFFSKCRSMSGWIASWCRYLLTYGKGAITDLCAGCSISLKNNTDLCRFLLPYLLIDCGGSVLGDSSGIVTIFRDECQLILQSLNGGNNKSATEWEYLVSSVQFIFTTIEILYQWKQELNEPIRKHYMNIADEVAKRDDQEHSTEYFPSMVPPPRHPKYDLIQQLLSCVSRQELSIAAHLIGAHARELRYFETWMRETRSQLHLQALSASFSSTSTTTAIIVNNYDDVLFACRNDGSGTSLPIMSASELDRLMILYQNLSDSDGIRGVSSVRRQQHMPSSVYHRIIELEHESEWMLTLEAYEEALTTFPTQSSVVSMSIDSSSLSDLSQWNISSKFNQSELSAGMFRNLAELGHFESLLNQASGKQGLEDTSKSVAYPYAIQASWQLQKWDLLSTLVDRSRDNTDDNHLLLNVSDHANHDRKLQIWTGSLLSILKSGDKTEFNRVIKDARCEILSSMESKMESYRLISPLMLQLHILREIEQCMNLPTSSSLSHEDVAQFDWKGRLCCMVSLPNSLMSVLSVRKAIMQLLHFNGDSSSDWLKLCKLGNEIGNYSLARYGLRQARAAGSVQDELDILESKILQSENYISRAVRLLEPSDIDVSNMRIELKRISGQDLRSSRGPQFSTAVQDLIRDTPRKEFFARKLLLSTIWMSESSQRHGRNIIERFKLVMEMCTTWEKGYYYFAKYVQYLADARKPVDDKFVDDSYIQYMTATIEHYCKCLTCGFKYLYSTLPRLLTLWFDFLLIGEGAVSATQSAELANLKKQQRSCSTHITNLMNNTPTSMWFVCLPQIVSRLNHPSEQVRETIILILSAIMKDHSSQAIWHLAAVIGSANPVRQHSSTRILATAKSHLEKSLRTAELSLEDSSGSYSTMSRQKTVRADRQVSSAQAITLRTQITKITNEIRMLSQATKLFSELVRLAEQTNQGSTSKHNIGLGIDLQNFLVPTLASLTVQFPNDVVNSFKSDFSTHHRISSPSTTTTEVIIIDKSSPNLSRAQEILSGWDAFPNGQDRFLRFLPDYEIMHSKAKPKKLVAETSSGAQVRFLVKQEKNGDLRKDARLMEFSGMINLLLHQDSEARQRKLGMKTYSVICLNEECGIIEWVDGTRIFRSVVSEASSHYEFSKRLPSYKKFRVVFEELQTRYDTKITELCQAYKTSICSQFPPCFHRWFLETFNDPTEWIEARSVFSRSAAVWSSFGHIVGLGDRHGENILIDIRTAECVHVDFDCLFDKGLVLNKPEIVPFRLTPNIIDGLGLVGYEGSFRRVMEVTMDVLRKNKVTILSAIEPFVRDPTVAWTRVGKVQQRSAVPIHNRQRASEEENENSTQILQKVRGRLDGNYNITHPFHDKVSKAYKQRGEALPLDSGLLNSTQENFALSVEGQVQRLIQEATSVPNLAQMFVGWMPWM